MKKIESAIYKTLIYQRIFNSIPTLENLQKFLISSKFISRKEIVNAINSSENIQVINNFVCFKKDQEKIGIIEKKFENSKKKIKKAREIARVLKIIPWFRMIGISGAVASFNAVEDDDIDFFVIVSKNRIWLARFCDYIILNLIRVRRNAKSNNLNNKICINFYLAEDNLKLCDQDIFTANEIARLIPLHGISVYRDFVKANSWISKYLANFWENFINEHDLKTVKRKTLSFFPFDLLNSFSGRMQKRYMISKMSREKVSEKEIRFHPKDLRRRVVDEYEERVRFLERE